MSSRVAAVVVAAGLLVAACDHGAMLVGDNRSDRELLARAVGYTFDGSMVSHPSEVVVVLPAKERQVIFKLPFAGGFKIQRVDILALDCAQIATIPVYGDHGTVLEVRDDLTLVLRDEYPQSGEPAEMVDRCRSTPSAAPFASASPTP